MILPDALLNWRDRIVMNAGFQRFTTRFPIFRSVSRHQSQALFDLCAGFVYTQILTACVELGLLEHLAKGPRSTAELAPLLGLNEAATERLLKACTALGLCSLRQGNRYGLGMRGAALLGNPGVTSMIQHHRLLYRDLHDPVALLRGEAGTTNLKAFWPYVDSLRPEGEATVGAYSQLMARSLSFLVDDVLAAYAFAAHRHMLDVGGGSGEFVIRVAAVAPALRFSILDLPAVAETANQRLKEHGLAERAVAIGGNAITGPLPSDADLVTLIRVLHDHDDDDALAFLATIHAGLLPGGTLLIAEPMAGLRGAERVADAYFGFYLLAMGSGRARSPQEITGMLQRTGFGQIKQVATPRPNIVSMITARRAA